MDAWGDFIEQVIHVLESAFLLKKKFRMPYLDMANFL